MPFIPAANTAQVELFFVHNSQQVENVFHVFQPAGWPITELQAIAVVFKDWWNLNMKAKVRPETILSSIKCTDISSQTGPSITSTVSLPIAGTFASGGPLSNNVTLAIKWLTNQRGRSFRGRTYHVGLHASQLATGAQTVNTADITSLSTAYAALLTAITTYNAAGYLAVVSRYHDNNPRANAVVTQITAGLIDNTIDSQRRRLPGRGR